MFIREIERTMDCGEYDVDVVNPTDNRREDLAEAVKAQGEYYVDLFEPPGMGSIPPHKLFKS